MGTLKKLLMAFGAVSAIAILAVVWAAVAAMLEQFKSLGPLRATRELQLRSYYFSPSAVTALFSLKATFANGEAVVNVTLIRRGLSVRVLSFYLRGIKMQRTEVEKTVQVWSTSGTLEAC